MLFQQKKKKKDICYIFFFTIDILLFSLKKNDIMLISVAYLLIFVLHTFLVNEHATFIQKKEKEHVTSHIKFGRI